MALKIGNITLESNVLLAPMAGVTDMPFRALVKKQGAGLVTSEMIASEAAVRQTRRTLKMIEKSPLEKPCAVQLAGCSPEVMAEAAKLNEELGAEIIDINMGCPVKKVVNGYAGSALMKDICLARKIIESVVKSVNVPVTLKMRTGWDEQHKNAPELAKIAEDSGIKMITVHGRTRSQMYNGRSDWRFIASVKEKISIPLIGNGDVVTEEDAAELIHQSGADGVMIGRGSFGRPWFLNQVAHFLKTGKKIPTPEMDEIHKLMKEHFEELLTHYGIESGVKIARKHIGWYSKGLFNSTQFRVSVNETDCPNKMRDLIDSFFEGKLIECQAC
ncbi:MAG: tRNA-dihydrouridine synthase B [Holosporales bacterium]